MPGSAGPRHGLVWGYVPGETGWGVAGFNPNFAKLDALVHLTVITITATPPATPANGDCYIVGDSPTGAWVGHADDVAVYYTSGGWMFIDPAVGVRAFDRSADGYVRFDGVDWIDEIVPAADVAGPASAVDAHIAVYDGTTGKIIKDGGQGLPAGFIVGTTDTQILTHKVIDGADNSLLVHLNTDVTGNLAVTHLNSGTGASSATFFRGDGTWATPAGGGGGGPAGLTTAAKTADYTVGAGETGTHYNNVGAAGAVVLTLPAAVANLTFGLAVVAAQYLTAQAAGSDVIMTGGISSAAGGFVRSNMPGSYMTLECHVAGQWITSSTVGAWSIDA